MVEHDDSDLRTAAKAAAATAAVGAAVGVARAIAARAEDAANHDDEHEEEREQDEPEVQAEHVEPELHEEEEEDEPEPEPVHEGTSVDRLRSLTDRARALLQELGSTDVESVTGIDRTREGWVITLEAVEVRRIPESTDVMATYDLELDGDGDLVRYERRRRYIRAQSDGDGG